MEWWGGGTQVTETSQRQSWLARSRTWTLAVALQETLVFSLLLRIEAVQIGTEEGRKSGWH